MLNRKIIRLSGFLIPVLSVIVIATIVPLFLEVVLFTPIVSPDINLQYLAETGKIPHVFFKVITFLTIIIFPAVVFFLYLGPVIYDITRDDFQTLSVKSRKRLINLPVFLVGLGLLGWVIGLAKGILELFVYVSEMFPHEKFMHFITLLSVSTLLTAALSAVMLYYASDFLNRKRFIPWMIPDGEISEEQLHGNLTINRKFFIFLFAVNLYPLFVITSTLHFNDRVYDFMPHMNFMIVLFALIGVVLTFIVAREYRVPLIELDFAVKDVRRGIYETRVDVVSADELGRLCAGVNEMAVSLKEKEIMKDTFGRIVDPAVRDYILGGHLELGGEVRMASVLFSDIRGFTSLSENLHPRKLMTMLNSYFEMISGCVSSSNGFVNKFIGDGVMAVFGVPVEIGSPCKAALDSAIMMVKSTSVLNENYIKNKFPPIVIGIGLHYGEVVAGNAGSSSRMEYSVLGDTVNTASRIEGLTSIYGASVIITEQLLSGLEDPTLYSFRFLNKLRVKGKNEPVSVFEVLDGLPEDEYLKKMDTKIDFEKGISLFYEKEFFLAREFFGKVFSVLPSDPAVLYYISRCDLCMRQGIHLGWDGIDVMETK